MVKINQSHLSDYYSSWVKNSLDRFELSFANVSFIKLIGFGSKNSQKLSKE